MTPTDPNSDTQMKIHMTTPGQSDDITPNQGSIGTTQGTNRDSLHSTMGINQKNRGGNKQSIQY